MAEIHKVLPSDEDFARMEGELFTRLERGHSRRIHRHRLVLVAAAALVVAGGSVAAGTVANPAAQTHLSYCYHGSDTSSAYSTTLMSDGQKRLPRSTSVAEALASCGSEWRQGFLGPKSDPKIQACLEDNLLVAVFPRKPGDNSSAAQFCDDLGMSAP
jgi:hypothetical protein